MTQLTETLSSARSVLMSCLQQVEAPHEADRSTNASLRKLMMKEPRYWK